MKCCVKLNEILECVTSCFFVYMTFMHSWCVCIHVLWELEKEVALFSSSDMHNPQVHINIYLQTLLEK